MFQGYKADVQFAHLWFLPRDAMHKRDICRHPVSVCASVTFVDHVKKNKHIFEIFSPSGSQAILVFPYQTGWRCSDGNPAKRGRRMQGGMKKWRLSTNISLYLRNGYSYMGTFSEAICKHRILFPSIQHLEWLPQGASPGKQKYGKNSDFFGLTHWLKHRITRKLLKIDRYMLRGVWEALHCLSIHATHCVIVAGASPGETKMWAAVRENGDFSRSWIMSKRINIYSNFFSPSGSHTILVYRSYTDTKHRAASLRQQSFLSTLITGAHWQLQTVLALKQ